MTRRLALAAFVVVELFVARAEAKDFGLVKEWSFAARGNAIVASLLAFDDTCAAGCRYHAPRVVKMVVLSQERTPESFFVWASVRDIQNSTWFSKVTVRREGHRVHLDSRMVGGDKALLLQKATGKPSDPAFDDCRQIYDVEEVFQGDRFVRTNVKFVSTVSISGLGALFGGGIVESRLEEAAVVLYRDLLRIPAEPPVEGRR